MKKFVATMASLLAVIILAVTFTACTTNVSGKTYVYSEVKVESEDDLSTTEQGLLTVAQGVVETAVKNYEITFNKDGTVTYNGTSVGNWTQDGKTVTANGTTYTVNGSKLEFGYTQSNFKFIVVLKKA